MGVAHVQDGEPPFVEPRWDLPVRVAVENKRLWLSTQNASLPLNSIGCFLPVIRSFSLPSAFLSPAQKPSSACNISSDIMWLLNWPVMKRGSATSL